MYSSSFIESANVALLYCVACCGVSLIPLLLLRVYSKTALEETDEVPAGPYLTSSKGIKDLMFSVWAGEFSSS